MKKSNLTKMFDTTRTLYSLLATSLKRTLKLINDESESASNLQVLRGGLSNTSLTYDGLEEINAQLVKMEIHKAEALRAMRDQNCRA